MSAKKLIPLSEIDNEDLLYAPHSYDDLAVELVRVADLIRTRNSVLDGSAPAYLVERERILNELLDN